MAVELLEWRTGDGSRDAGSQFSTTQTGARRDNKSPSGNVGFNDPLTPGVANGAFTSGLAHPITLQSNLGGGNPVSPNPRGTNGLRLWNALSGGAASDYVTAGNVDVTTRVDSLDIILAPADRIRGVSFNPTRPNAPFPVEVRVYDTDNNLLEVMTSVAADQAGTNFVGVVTTAGALIGRINIFSPTQEPEGADNIALFAAAPGDFNIDGKVDGADLAQWAGDFGVNGFSDADRDGDSDGADFLAWQRGVGLGVAATASSHGAGVQVPEPALGTFLPSVTTLVIVIERRRRRQQARCHRGRSYADRNIEGGSLERTARLTPAVRRAHAAR